MDVLRYITVLIWRRNTWPKYCLSWVIPSAQNVNACFSFGFPPVIYKQDTDISNTVDKINDTGSMKSLGEWKLEGWTDKCSLKARFPRRRFRVGFLALNLSISLILIIDLIHSPYAALMSQGYDYQKFLQCQPGTYFADSMCPGILQCARFFIVMFLVFI